MAGKRHPRKFSEEFKRQVVEMLFATTELDRATWMRFAECHVDALPLAMGAVSKVG